MTAHEQGESVTRDMLAALPVAIYELDAEGIVLFANPAYASITGYPLDELVGMHVQELMAPGPERDATPALFEQLVADMPPPMPIVAENLTRAGRRVHVEIHWNYRCDEDGRAVGFVCALEDITERMRVQEELRLSEERFRRVFDQSPLAMVAYSSDGRPLYVNTRQMGLMGLPEDQVAVAMAHYNILEDSQLAALGLMPTIVEGFSGKPVALPTVFYEPRKMNPPLDQDALWLRGFVYPVTDATGEVREVVVSFEDVTKERAAEERQAALETRLQHAQKMESLSVLAGGIAHDFNNLLVAVLGNADLALMDLPPESPVRGAISDIVAGASRAADLVRQLLAYSGRSLIEKGLLDLSTVVEEVGHLVEAGITKKAALRRELARDLPAVEADATQLRQIVMNLIINASEALGGGSGSIAIRTGSLVCDADTLAESYLDDDLPGGLYCFIEVEDTGVGMDAETQERLFEPFFTTKFTGRGLGLAAVLGIVRAHRGAIQVRSEPGEGTTFRVLLPATDGAAARKEADEPTKEWKGQGRILVVDDEEAVRHVAERMLQRLGFEVVTAGDGRQAIDMVRDSPDDFVGVLLDLAMPHMDGAECLRELSHMRPGLPVLISSGFGESDVASQFTDASPAGFVQKPYKLAALSDALRDAIG